MGAERDVSQGRVRFKLAAKRVAAVAKALKARARASKGVELVGASQPAASTDPEHRPLFLCSVGPRGLVHLAHTDDFKVPVCKHNQGAGKASFRGEIDVRRSLREARESGREPCGRCVAARPVVFRQWQ